MPTSDQRALARRLVKEHGVTLCEAAGISFRDKPAPPWRLLVRSLLQSAPRGAREAGLPEDHSEWASLVRGDQLPRLTAACARVARDPAVIGA